ncbi:MAG TPA: hypothetical protein VMG38_17120 [Trebonia sp.]|nr:hypothetical protein [Trebonia sp.]
MSLSVIALRRYPRALTPDRVEVIERSVERRVKAAYALLFFNTLTFFAGISALPFPSKVGKGIAQASLPLAILLLLTVNKKLKIRPNVFLCIVSLLVADGVITAMAVHHPGTIFRTFRFAEYVFALWLLTPWWGRRDLMLLRFHLKCLYVAIGSVFVGLCVAPGHAFEYDGRLTGVIWPLLPTVIGQLAAVAAGLTILLWLGHELSGRRTLAGVGFAVAILLLTHTRTALVALIAGLIIAGLSLFTVNARVRKLFGIGVVTVSLVVVTAAGFITTWLARGQSTSQLTGLTGRTDFWALVLNLPRDRFQEIFGFGLSNASVNGLPIDSNWLSSYLQEGLWGVGVCAMILLFLLAASLFQPPGLRRAVVLFIVTYCLIASFTEDAFTDVSTYLLHLFVAASLLV